MKILASCKRFSPGLPHYIFAGVFGLRLMALDRLSSSPLLLPSRGDMHFYNDWALRILRGEFDIHSAFYGLPLYAYALAGLYSLFGYSHFVPGLVQSLADSGTAVLIYLISLRLIESTGCAGEQEKSCERSLPPNQQPSLEQKTFACISALAWGFFVPAQAYAIVLMPTAICALVLWYVVWRIVGSVDDLTAWQMFRLALLIGISAMAIATSLFLLPLLAAAVFLRNRFRTSKIVTRNVMALIAGILLGTAPCWIHNYLIARDPVFLSGHGGVNFWIGNNPTANGYPKFPPGLRAGQAAMLQDSVSTAEAAAGRPLKRAEVSAFWANKAREYIKQQPLEWLHLLLLKSRNFWNAFQYDDLSVIANLREQGIIFRGLYFGVVAVFGLFGAAITLNRVREARWVAAAVFLQMAALMSVFVTERYRLPAAPGLLMLAGIGLWLVWRSLVQPRGGELRRAIGYSCSLVVAAAFVSWPQRDPALWALESYNSGWQALECGDLPLAAGKLTTALQYVPENAETNFALGNLKLAQGRVGAAQAFYLTTLRLDKSHRGALNNLGVVALERGEYKTAEVWLEQAEQIEPLNSKTHFLLATALFRQSNFEAAQSEVDAAISLNPNQVEFQDLRSRIAEWKRLHSPNRQPE